MFRIFDCRVNFKASTPRTKTRRATEGAGLLLVCSALIGAVGDARSDTLIAAPGTLHAILTRVKAGDTVFLEPGSYSPVSLQDSTFEPPITITGGVSASLKGLRITNASGIRIVGVELKGPAEGQDYPFFVANSSNIQLRNLHVSANPSAWGALRLEKCQNVSITESDFRDASTAISWSKCDNFEVSDTEFHDLVSDGISGTGGSTISFLRNRFHDFHPRTNDHPDAIQLWSIPNTTSKDILISDNYYHRGSNSGSGPAQGIFVTGGGPNPRFNNVRVLGNIVLGGMFNGIMVTGTDGVEIMGNRVAGYSDQQSWIRYDDNSEQRILSNQAQAYISKTQPPGGGVAPPGNTMIPSAANDDIFVPR